MIEEFLLRGFDLDIYSLVEYAMVYWYSDYVFANELDILESLATMHSTAIVASKKKKNIATPMDRFITLTWIRGWRELTRAFWTVSNA